MREWELIARAPTPEGGELTLHRSGRSGHAFLIRVDGRGLMGSDQHGSEEALASLGCARARSLAAPVVLVGGLGMGFTVRAALDALPADATVVVAELSPAVVAWNRGVLGDLAGRPLEDARVRVEVGDVCDALREYRGYFDAILLDVDNGPVALSQDGNGRLYGDAGLADVRAALKPGGVVAVWSAWADRKFEHRMRHAGFAAEAVHVRARLTRGGPNHTIFVGAVDGPVALSVRSEGAGRARPPEASRR